MLYSKIMGNGLLYSKIIGNGLSELLRSSINFPNIDILIMW